MDMNTQKRNTKQLRNAKSLVAQRDVALFFAVFVLLLLSVLTAAHMLLYSTKTTINANYRSEEIAFFAAKAGMEEIMDRMKTDTTQTPLIAPPASAPSS